MVDAKSKKDKKEAPKEERELALSDLDGGSTLDAALCAEARFVYQMSYAGTKCEKASAYADFIVSVGLHLIAQVFQFVIMTYFEVGFVNPFMFAFDVSPGVKNMKHEIALANATNNPGQVGFTTRATCAQNTSYPWTHRMMMFILLAKLLPEFGSAFWRLYFVWRTNAPAIFGVTPTRNHHKPEEPEVEIDANGNKVDAEAHHGGYQWKDGKGLEELTAALDAQKDTYTKALHAAGELDWRDDIKVSKEWKQRTLILDHTHTHTLKVGKVPKDGKDLFPLHVYRTEYDGEHHIGEFSLPWKLFATLFLLLPNIVLNFYILKLGATLVSYTGRLNKLIKIALKVKFLLGIPDLVFEGYNSENLETFISKTVYYTSEACPTYDKKTDRFGETGRHNGGFPSEFPWYPRVWYTWGGTVFKFIMAGIIAPAIYDYGFGNIVEFRTHCTDFYTQFSGSVIAPRQYMTMF